MINGTGNSAANTLKGGGGDDALNGGAGADKLYGGAGADVFVFLSVTDSTYASSGRDTIYDFNRSQKDKIDLSAIDAGTKAGGQHFVFIGDEKFSKSAGELRYEKKANGTYIYGDINGDGTAEFSIFVDASISFSKSGFILVA